MLNKDFQLSKHTLVLEELIYHSWTTKGEMSLRNPFKLDFKHTKI